jgi:hypothetical protein
VSLDAVESLRFGLYEVIYIILIILTWQTIIVYTAAARRKRGLKHAAKKQGATTDTGGIAADSYVNATSASSC